MLLARLGKGMGMLGSSKQGKGKGKVRLGQAGGVGWVVVAEPQRRGHHPNSGQAGRWVRQVGVGGGSSKVRINVTHTTVTTQHQQ